MIPTDPISQWIRSIPANTFIPLWLGLSLVAVILWKVLEGRYLKYRVRRATEDLRMPELEPEDILAAKGYSYYHATGLQMLRDRLEGKDTGNDSDRLRDTIEQNSVKLKSTAEDPFEKLLSPGMSAFYLEKKQDFRGSVRPVCALLLLLAQLVCWGMGGLRMYIGTLRGKPTGNLATAMLPVGFVMLFLIVHSLNRGKMYFLREFRLLMLSKIPATDVGRVKLLLVRMKESRFGLSPSEKREILNAYADGSLADVGAAKEASEDNDGFDMMPVLLFGTAASVYAARIEALKASSGSDASGTSCSSCSSCGGGGGCSGCGG